jgi:hypothetical protein
MDLPSMHVSASIPRMTLRTFAVAWEKPHCRRRPTAPGVGRFLGHLREPRGHRFIVYTNAPVPPQSGVATNRRLRSSVCSIPLSGVDA